MSCERLVSCTKKKGHRGRCKGYRVKKKRVESEKEKWYRLAEEACQAYEKRMDQIGGESGTKSFVCPVPFVCRDRSTPCVILGAGKSSLSIKYISL